MTGLDFKLFRGQRIRTGSGSDWVAYSIMATAGADIVLLPTDPVATAPGSDLTSLRRKLPACVTEAFEV